MSDPIEEVQAYYICQVCGRDNHPAQKQCWICGTPLDSEGVVPPPIILRRDPRNERGKTPMGTRIFGGITLALGILASYVVVGAFIALAFVAALFSAGLALLTACAEICTGGVN